MKLSIFTACLVCSFGSQAFAASTNVAHPTVPDLSLKLPKGSTVLIYRTGFGALLSKGISAVSEPSPGVFCVTPTRISPTGSLPIVGVEWGYSFGFALEAYYELGAFDCAAHDVEVRTYDFNAGGYPVASDNVAFSLYISSSP